MTFHFGVDYYPEHWPRERWEPYAAQMREAHFNVVRLAEFFWVLLEPEEGRFDFAWLDDAIAVLHREGTVGAARHAHGGHARLGQTQVP